MNDIFNRAELLFGHEGMEVLAGKKVIVFGVGGVGSWAAECLVRTGIQRLTIADPDDVSPTNINRQLMATTATVGSPKADVLAKRLKEINPDAEIEVRKEFYCEETAGNFPLDDFDYVIDAIDSLKDKVLLISNATRSKTKFFSSMGAALKMDPTRIKVAEFRQAKGCPLARAIRQRFKRAGNFPKKKFKVVFSDELLPNVQKSDESCSYKAAINGSLCHITAIFGMTLAGLVIEDIYNHINIEKLS